MSRHSSVSNKTSHRIRRRALWLTSLTLAGLLLGIGAATVTTAIRHSDVQAGTTHIDSALSSNTASPTDTASSPATPSGSQTATDRPTTPAEMDARFTILAAGDVLTHGPVNNAARAGTGYDYSPLLAGLDKWVSGADLALCHLEVPIAPAGTKPSGYPRFGAPVQILDGLKKQGWDGCSTASNHTIDRGFDGVKTTISAFDKRGLGHVGSATTKAQSTQPQVYELTRGGQKIRVAHIAQAYGTNGLPLPAGKPWAVALINADTVIAEAKQARADGADLVVVSLHFGQEYQSTPTAQQISVTQQLADSGVVDLVIGHHAHVPQEIVKLSGGPGGKGMWTAYGLGNMISSQDSACCVAQTDSGLMMLATVEKPVGGAARVTGVQWQGITVDRLGKQRVYAFADIPQNGIGTLSTADIKARYGRVRAVVGTTAQETDNPPTPTGDPPTVIAHSAK